MLAPPLHMLQSAGPEVDADRDHDRYLSLFSHLYHSVNVLFAAVFSFASDIDCRHMNRVRTLSHGACEAWTQKRS